MNGAHRGRVWKAMKSFIVDLRLPKMIDELIDRGRARLGARG